MKIKVKVNDKYIHALVDSGASESLIGLESLPVESSLTEGSSSVMEALGKSRVDILGRINLNFLIFERSQDFEFSVVPEGSIAKPMI